MKSVLCQGVRTVALASAVLITALSIPAMSAPAAAATGSGVTVSGSWHRWDPLATDNGDGTYSGAYDTKAQPSVSVDQTDNLVDQVVKVSWRNFTPTSNDVLYSGVPDPGVTLQPGSTLYPVKIYQCRGTDPTVSPADTEHNKDCYAADAGPGAVDGGHGQNNAITAVTQDDGTGSVDFHVENRPNNDLLGCDATQACSIVVVPNNGGVQFNLSRDHGEVACDDHGQDFLGPPDYDQFEYTAESTFLGAACSWADRIVVPIHFAPVAADCPNAESQFAAVGSPMLERGFNQLQAGWCTGKDPLNFSYNSTSNEYEARSLFGAASGGLTAATDVALVTQPADPATAGTRKFTYAPIANDAIAIPYYVDNVKTGQPMTDLRLDARLVAKLLTQSYQPFYYNCDGLDDKTKPAYGCAPTVSGNPASIFDDPEFQKLNFRGDHDQRADFPSSATTGNQDGLGGFFPTVGAGDSDLTWELTRWIASDADAKAFLAGKADPSGMHVNSSYLLPKGAALYPTSQLQALDPGWSPERNDTKQHFFEGFQGSWNPVTGLNNVAAALVGNQTTALDVGVGHCQAQAQEDCIKNPGIPVNFTRVAAEPIGTRDLWAIVDNTAASAYRFPTAQLVNAAGNSVAPDAASISASLATMKTNPDKITQYVDHSAEAATGYPLTEPVYAMVPTCGLSKAKVSAVTSMLMHVVDSQSYGVQPGTIAPGLQGLTTKQLAQTRSAAKAVSTRSCTAPPKDTSIAGAKHMLTGHNGTAAALRHNGGSTGGSGAGAGAGSGSGAGSGGNAAANTTGSKKSSAAAPNPASTGPSASAVQHAGYKPAGQSGSLSMALPIMLLLGGACLLGGPLTWWLAATPGGRTTTRRLRQRLLRMPTLSSLPRRR